MMESQKNKLQVRNVAKKQDRSGNSYYRLLTKYDLKIWNDGEVL